MLPPDAIDGWDDENNAELYSQFTRDYPLYTDTSHDLAARADLTGKRIVVDLCGGTGITGAVLLETMPADGRIISVDAAKAMQTVGQRTYPDQRITWVVARAESLADHISGPIDAVVCNSAIWKTDTIAVFTAAKCILRPGGRFVFNIGGAFASLGSGDHEARATPSLNDLITAIAVADYGYVPRHEKDSSPPLDAVTIREQLEATGFTVLATDTVVHTGTMAEKRAWLSIPLFARPPGQLTHAQRMTILQRAYAQVDKTQANITPWLVVTAEA